MAVLHDWLDGRTELLARTQYVGPDDRPGGRPGSVLVTYDDTARLGRAVSRRLAVEKVISDVDNRQAAAILRKQR